MLYSTRTELLCLSALTGIVSACSSDPDPASPDAGGSADVAAEVDAGSDGGAWEELFDEARELRAEIAQLSCECGECSCDGSCVGRLPDFSDAVLACATDEPTDGELWAVHSALRDELRAVRDCAASTECSDDPEIPARSGCRSEPGFPSTQGQAYNDFLLDCLLGQ